MFCLTYFVLPPQPWMRLAPSSDPKEPPTHTHRRNRAGMSWNRWQELDNPAFVQVKMPSTQCTTKDDCQAVFSVPGRTSYCHRLCQRMTVPTYAGQSAEYIWNTLALSQLHVIVCTLYKELLDSSRKLSSRAYGPQPSLIVCPKHNIGIQRHTVS